MKLQVSDLKMFALLDVRNNMEWLSKVKDSDDTKKDCKKSYRIKMQMIFDCLSKYINSLEARKTLTKSYLTLSK